MPQIAQIASTYAGQIFWLLIVFGLIYFGIGRAMLPKIEATVDMRARKVADDLAAAEAARSAADATEEAWRTKMTKAKADAQAETAAAKTKAALAAEKRVKAADVTAAAKIAEAEASIRTSTEVALSSIEGAAAEAAQDIVAKLSGAKISAAAAMAAVKQAIPHG
jgi:F-type H+-transporting ATPase subunit b